VIRDQHRKRARKEKNTGKMPKKTHAYYARAKNLENARKQITKPMVEEVDDDHANPPHTHTINPNTSSCQHLDISSDPELLDIIGALRGVAMIDDEDDISESGSENDGDEENDVIQEITALEHFTSTLQKAHDLAAAAEREREKGGKRPKMYAGNSNRTKWRCQQR
jgi:hypothetical protein